ncbi:hypothetical protein TcCL_Unassigned01920 [Trypanosoma cruzi]|nr:hypothetical protein TcCL_Unassigned01920 [Trypanosoma cruzi]
MGGKGDDGIRETVALLVALPGDRSAAVGASALPEGRRHKLCGRDYLDGSSRGKSALCFRVIFLGATSPFGCVIRLCGGSVEGRTWMDRAHPSAAPHFAERLDQIAGFPFACLTGSGDLLRSGASAWTVALLRRPWLRGMSCGVFLRFRTTVERRTFHASSTSRRVDGGITVV